jgi:hypothetical protein
VRIGACLTSERQNWKTPKRTYEELDKEFHFDYDPCPNDDSLVGFLKPWGSRSFCNPPYSEIADWVKHAYEQSLLGKLVVMLIPSRTDTKWWHDYVMKSKEIRFIKGRLCFDDSGNNAPFPSCIVVFESKFEKGRKSWGSN